MKYLIFLNIIGFAAAFTNSTVVLFSKNNVELGYGVIAAPDTIILPNEKIYEDTEKFAILEKYRKYPPHFVEYKLLSHKFTKIDNNTFMLKLSKISKITDGNFNLRISRYPVCDNVTNFFVESRSELVPKSFSGKLCGNGRVVCDDNQQVFQIRRNFLIGSPLMDNMDNVNYLIGMMDITSNKFNLLTQPCNILPNYEYCSDNMSPSTAAIMRCNAVEMTQNLKDSGHLEIVLIGTIERGYPASFVPTGFAVIVSDRHAIVFSDFTNAEIQIKHFEIYGSGKEKDVAIMSKKKVIVLGNYQKTEIGNSNINLLKFTESTVFEGWQKATFSFDDSYANATDFENFETLKFINKKLVIQNGTETKNEFKFLMGTPVFHNGEIIGFQVKGLFISVFEMKEFLEENVPTLIFETITTTTVTQTPITALTLSSTIPSTTMKSTDLSVNKNSTTLNPKPSQSVDYTLSFGVLSLIMFVHLL